MNHFISKLIRLIFVFQISAFMSCTNSSNRSSEKSVDVNDVKVELPKYEGFELVEINCVPCHSLRYIEMQPEMTKKSWEKIVNKMIKNFGAPIKDTLTANQIIAYLVSIKGKKE